MPSLIGNKPNQVPTNGDLGTMAFEDADNVIVGNLNATGVTTVRAGTAAAPAITTTGDTNTGIFFPAADTIAFAEGGTEVARFDSSGNLGIGTASPTSKLDVSGELKTLNDTAATGVIIKRTGGVNANGAVNFVGSDDAVDASIRMATDVANALVFTAGGTTERMRIDSSGNLLVGTTGANGKIVASGFANSVCGRFEGNPAGSLTMIQVVSTATSGTNRALAFIQNNGEAGTITLTNTTVAYNTSSDYRLKENIAPMTGALAKVTQLKPVTYTWKATGETSQGFIAHELQEVVPDCVTGEKDAVQLVDITDEEGKVIGQEEKPVYQGIDTSFLVATLTAAIQEIKAELDSVKAELATLKGTA